MKCLNITINITFLILKIDFFQTDQIEAAEAHEDFFFVQKERFWKSKLNIKVTSQ